MISSMQEFWSIWSIEGTLIGTSITDHSGSESNSYKGVLHLELQSTVITRTISFLAKSFTPMQGSQLAYSKPVLLGVNL